MTPTQTYFIGNRPVSIDEYAAGDPLAVGALAAARNKGADEDAAVQYAVGLYTRDELVAAVGEETAAYIEQYAETIRIRRTATNL
jgi:hypothetical protein